MKRCVLCRMIVLLALTGACVVQGQEQIARQARQISLHECIELALQHNLAIGVARFSSQFARYELKAQYGAYDPTFTFSATRKFVDQPSTFDPKKLNNVRVPPLGFSTNIAGSDFEYEQTLDSVGPSLEGRLPFGLTYSIFARADHPDSSTFPYVTDPLLLPPGAPLNVAYTNNYFATTGFTLRQPLLKDFWIDIFRRDIMVRKKEFQIAEIGFEGSMMTNVTTVVVEYYNLLYAKAALNLEREALEIASRFFEQTKRRVEANAVPLLDQQWAESYLHSVETILAGAEETYFEHENALKNVISDNLSVWSGVQLEPSDALIIVPEHFQLHEAWKTAVERRPDLREMKLRLEQQHILMQYDFNQRFPTLDLVGAYGWQEIDNSFGLALSELGGAKHEFYTVGAVLSFPIGGVTARNSYKARQVAKEQLTLLLRKEEQDALTRVETLVHSSEASLKQVESTRKARESAEQAVAGEKRLYELGGANAFLYLEYERNVIGTRRAELRVLADYNIALAQLALEEGMTLERNAIQLNYR